MKKLTKKGQFSGISKPLMSVLGGILVVVVLFAALPELWTLLSDSLTNISTADIPILSSMTGIIGLVFGVGVFGAAIYYITQIKR